MRKLLLNKYTLMLILIVLAYGAGNYFAPDKIKIKEKIVYITEVEKEKTKKTTKKYDPVTGKLIEETTETGSKERTVDKIGQEKEKTIEKTKKHYAAKLGVATPLKDFGKLVPRIGGEIRLPFFSSWAGLEIDVDINRPVLGGYLRIEF